MAVVIGDIMDVLNSEDFEQPMIEKVLMPQAEAYIEKFLNRNYDDLDDSEKLVYDRIIIMIVADWYSHPDGGGRNSGSTKYTGINMVIDSIRAPGFEALDSTIDNGGLQDGTI